MLFGVRLCSLIQGAAADGFNGEPHMVSNFTARHRQIEVVSVPSKEAVVDRAEANKVLRMLQLTYPEIASTASRKMEPVLLPVHDGRADPSCDCR